MYRFALICLLLVGCSRPAVDKQEPSATSSPKVYDRAEFKKLVVGETLDEIRKVLGPPDDIVVSTWVYHSRTRDPKTGEVDSDANIGLNEAGDRGNSVVFMNKKKQFSRE